MEIFQLLDNLEDLIENSKKVPLSDKSMIDKDEILEVLKEIRLKLPDELKQAKWVKEERERILAKIILFLLLMKVLDKLCKVQKNMQMNY